MQGKTIPSIPQMPRRTIHKFSDVIIDVKFMEPFKLFCPIKKLTKFLAKRIINKTRENGKIFLK